MKNFALKHIAALLLLLATTYDAFNQNSVLINFGRSSCYDNTPPSFSLIKNPLGTTSSLMATCNLGDQLPDFYNVFIAFNPLNNKIYVADIRTGVTKIWVLDVGLPGSIECPASIPTAPTYTYNYVSNNFEFDKNGDLWSLSSYNAITGQCNFDKFDVNTGQVINTRILQFPAGNFPTAITSGDICIAPNGRMFATLGSFPSQLYEITNYNSTTTATATYLKTLPLNCYGIAYLDGKLEITGFDEFGCYYYTYNIATAELRGIDNFQNGQLPVDNSSFTPAVGATKRIASAVPVNANTADIVYEIYVQNMGNVVLNDINVTDDLLAAFGAGNVSDVSVSFTPGANNAGLTLNATYNGTSTTSLLNNGQQLSNQKSSNQDFYFKIQVACRVTNLNPSTTYYNSAIAKATINNAVDPINVSDSSNNGLQTVIDPNNDGFAGGIGENVPTPFNLAALPVKFISMNAKLNGKHAAELDWRVATPVANAAYFEPEFSLTGNDWITLTQIPITETNRSAYDYVHTNIPAGNLYYRVKQTDIDGQFVYSRVVLLQRSSDANNFRVYPTPADHVLSISAPFNTNGKTTVMIHDLLGRNMITTTMKSSLEINTAPFPTGTYILRIVNDEITVSRKIVIHH